jgi:hypothetical protein
VLRPGPVWGQPRTAGLELRARRLVSPCALTPQATAAAGPRCRRRLRWGGPVREGAHILTVLTIVAPIEPKKFLHVTHVIIGYSVFCMELLNYLMAHTEFSLILFNIVALH